MRSTYAEHAATLDPRIVAALWSVTPGPGGASPAPVPHRVMPDGCLDVVLRVRASEPGSIADPDLFIAGPARGASLVAVEPDSLFLGLRFQPGRGGAALGVAAPDLADLTLAGAEARAVLGILAEGLHGARDVAALRDRLAALALPLSARARERAGSPHAQAAIALLRRSRGRARIGEVAGRLDVSERSLRRAITEAAGLAPKTLATVLRFQHALALVRRGVPLAEAALRGGYSDQAHMTRAFRRLGGLTPGASAA